MTHSIFDYRILMGSMVMRVHLPDGPRNTATSDPNDVAVVAILHVGGVGAGK